VHAEVVADRIVVMHFMDNCPGRVNVSGRTNNDIIYWVFVITKLVIQVNALLTYFIYIYI
jgi:hypothetical protein